MILHLPKSLSRLGPRIAFESMVRRLRCRAAERELRQLDDRTLRDIGLTRGEIHAAAYGLLPVDHLSKTRSKPQPTERKPGRVAPMARRLAAALCLTLAMSAPAARGDEFARLPTVADLPPGTVKVSPPVPGMGEHWANPKDLPLGPIYCVMRGRVICAEFMVAQEDFAKGRSYERLRFGLGAKQPPIDHLDLTFLPHGHEGFEVPHYDLHMYFISPAARFAERTASR
jgi:uncharacterized protein YjiS (DUF1127 family)